MGCQFFATNSDGVAEFALAGAGCRRMRCVVVVGGRVNLELDRREGKTQ